ncbi:MAG: sel1 repeat family protein [Desulfatibacillum sp.]|nr:sel1 repeat family protein [Desulfatibacillum sp.]
MLSEKTNLSLFIVAILAVMTVLSCTGVNMQGQLVETAPIVQEEQPPTPDALAMGQRYFKGDGVERDYSRAASYFQEAADQDNPEAWHMLGLMHLNGMGFDQDIKAGARAFAKAANLGHTESQYQLGALFFSAEAYEDAFQWALPAAKNNHAKAQFLLGMMFMEVGDDSLAIEWLARSTALGYSPAMGILGTLGASPQSMPDPSAPIRDDMLINPFK